MHFDTRRDTSQNDHVNGQILATVDDIHPALPYGIYSLFWVMQDLYHQP